MSESTHKCPPVPSTSLYEAVLLVAVAVLTFAPLWSVELTNTDDMVYSQLGYTHDWDSPVTNALGMGRFYYLYSGYLYMVPYLCKSFWYFKLCSLGPLLIIPLLLGRIVQWHVKTPSASVLTCVLYCICLQFYTDYYPTTAFPFVFTFSITLFLFSYLCWLRYQQLHSRRDLIVHWVFFTFAMLPYETFVLLFFGLMYMAAFFSAGKRSKGLLAQLVSGFESLKGHGLILLGYALAYVAFALLPTPEGFSRDHYHLSENGLQLRSVATALGRFSSSALPLMSLAYANTRYITDWYWNDPQHFVHLADILRVAQVDWWLRGTFAACLVVNGLRHVYTTPYRTLIALASCGIFVFFCSPLLHSLTDKYQQFVERGVFVYLPTFFSFLGFVLFAFACLVGVNQCLQRTRLYPLWTVAIALTVIGISMLHSFNNYHVARYQAHHGMTWSMMRQIVRSSSFASIPDGTIVYTPTLPRASVAYDMLAGKVGDYWTDWIEVECGKRLQLIYTREQLAAAQGEPMMFLAINRLPKDFEAFCILANISATPIGESINANELTLFTYSKYKEFELVLNSQPAGTESVISIEGSQRQLNAHGSTRAWVIRGVADGFVSTRISGRDIDVNSVNIAFFKPLQLPYPE